MSQERRKSRQASKRRRPFALVVLLIGWFGIGFLLASGVTWALGRTGDPYGRAKELLAAERYPEALDELRKASRRTPEDPRPYHQLGNVYRKLLLDDRAERAYREAVRLDPGFRPAKEKLAEVLYELGKNEAAIRLLKELMKETPKDPFLWFELAINEMHLGRPEKAIRLLEMYNAAEGKQALGYARLGRAHADAGNLAAAEEAYREALKIDPRMANCRLWLGQLLIATGRGRDARRWLESFHKLRDLQTKEHDHEMALLRNPDDVKRLFHLARTRQLLGKTREALIPLRKAMKLLPGDKDLTKFHQDLLRSLEKERTGSAGPAPRG